MTFLIWREAYVAFRRRVYMPQVGAPMQRDKQHQQQPGRRIERCGGDEPDLFDQVAAAKRPIGRL